MWLDPTLTTDDAAQWLELEALQALGASELNPEHVATLHDIAVAMVAIARARVPDETEPLLL